jgi:hypothetical protein
MHNRLLALAVAVVTAVSMGCSQSPSAPAAPSPADPASAGALPDGATLKVTAPTLMSPVGGVLVEDLDPDLVIGNSQPMFVPSLPLAYVFEVRNAAGQVVYTSSPIAQGGGGTTRHEIAIDLEPDTNHTWRAWATYQGQRGPFSETAQFTTYIPGPGGASCAHLSTGPNMELFVVQCRRTQFGFMSAADRVEFLRRIAWDLNRAPYSDHPPYGILIKIEGHNCFGYSCDIICSGQGGGQRQWDVMIDEDVLQLPAWGRVENATPRPCEFQ